MSVVHIGAPGLGSSNAPKYVKITTFDDGRENLKYHQNRWEITGEMFGGGKLSLRNVEDGTVVDSISAWKTDPIASDAPKYVKITTFDDGREKLKYHQNKWEITEERFGGGKLSLRNVEDGTVVDSISLWKTDPITV